PIAHRKKLAPNRAPAIRRPICPTSAPSGSVDERTPHVAWSEARTRSQPGAKSKALVALAISDAPTARRHGASALSVYADSHAVVVPHCDDSVAGRAHRNPVPGYPDPGFLGSPRNAAMRSIALVPQPPPRLMRCGAWSSMQRGSKSGAEA